MADVVLPAGSFAEKYGTFTSVGKGSAAGEPGDQAGRAVQERLRHLQSTGLLLAAHPFGQAETVFAEITCGCSGLQGFELQPTLGDRCQSTRSRAPQNLFRSPVRQSPSRTGNSPWSPAAPSTTAARCRDSAKARCLSARRVTSNWDGGCQAARHQGRATSVKVNLRSGEIALKAKVGHGCRRA